jgi:hypothetical protein
MLQNILTLCQNAQATLWLGVKLHGLRSNTRPKHIDFYLIFEILWPRVINFILISRTLG